MTITTPTGTATFKGTKTKDQYKALVKYLRILNSEKRDCIITFN